MIYNKLVRDKIPDIIEKNGDTCTFHTANTAEYEQKLHEKLGEEVTEFLHDTSKSEIADILEVLEALAHHYKYSWGDILTIQKQKKEERGGFAQRIILEKADTQ